MDINIISFIEPVILIFTFVIAVFAYVLATGQFYHAVMVSCIERFSKLLPKLKDVELNPEIMNGIPETTLEENYIDIIEAYIDLCNEELFYFEHGYLPNPVRNEWLEGMTYFLPIYYVTKEDNVPRMLNSSSKTAIYIDKHNKLLGYERIKRVFTIRNLEGEVSQYMDEKGLLIGRAEILPLLEKNAGPKSITGMLRSLVQ